MSAVDREALAEVLAGHAVVTGFHDTDGDLWRNYACSCGWWSTADRERDHRLHVADALLPLLAQVKATARAEALREAADALSDRLDQFTQHGRHTRARWAEQWLRDRSLSAPTEEAL